MGVLIVPETAEAAERRKFEAMYSPYGPGERPYVYREFPLTLHKAGRPLDKDGNVKLGAAEIVETREVSNLDEEVRENAYGFYRDPSMAVAKLKAQDVEIAKLAANIEHQKMHGLSAKAVAEVEAAQNAHAGHMPMVPVTPIKKRRGPNKKKDTTASEPSQTAAVAAGA